MQDKNRQIRVTKMQKMRTAVWISDKPALRHVDKILGLEPPEEAQEKEQSKPER